MLKKWERAIIGGLAVALALALWEISVAVGWSDPSHVSRPYLVVKAFMELLLGGEVLLNLAISLKEFILGFVLAIVVGIPVGVILGRWKLMTYLFDPVLMALYTMPRLAMMPLLVVWFGVGLGATIAVVFLGSVFPIFINTAVGIREVDPSWVRAAESFGGNQLDIFIKVLVPGSIPPIMSGLRLGVGRGLLGMVVSEMYAGTEGIGHLINLYATSFRISELMALIGIVGVVGFIAVQLSSFFENKVRYWGKEIQI